MSVSHSSGETEVNEFNNRTTQHNAKRKHIENRNEEKNSITYP